MALFSSERVGCVTCHSGPNFSGGISHERSATDAAPAFANTGLYNIDGKGSYPVTDAGLIEVTGRDSDMGKFHVPTLRNVGSDRTVHA